jgi:hypothetical protein
VWQLPVCQPPKLPAKLTASSSGPAGGPDPELRAWLRESDDQFAAMAAHLRAWHEARVTQLQAAASAARATLWWPFTQHTSVRASPLCFCCIIATRAAALRMQTQQYFVDFLNASV